MSKPWEAAGIQYVRECTTDDCKHEFGVPTIEHLMDGFMKCPDCGGTYDIDKDDCYVLIAWLLARVERLERAADKSPLAGLGI